MIPLPPRWSRRATCPVVLMHMRGTPATMSAMATYGDVVAEVRAELLARVDVRAGLGGICP